MTKCNHCVLDTNDDSTITFDKKGVCNYCTSYYEAFLAKPISDVDNKKILDQKIKEIKQISKGKEYDCIIGLSGGVDSSYLAYKAKEFGLNCLLVHFDNGWNSDLATQNIYRISKHTGFELYTYVVNWEEFKSLQLAYVRAGVIDWEVPTDHGFYACLNRIAYKYKITCILAGFNHQTEFILPKVWTWRKNDLANLIDINRKFGTKKLKTYPQLSFLKALFYNKVNKLDVYPLLEYMPYNKDNAKQEIIEKIGWKDYGGKHYESIFTRFYQGYVLPKKFGVDKRKAHLSNLICSGQLTKDKALKELEKPPYDIQLAEKDLEYFLKKMEMSSLEFDKIMNTKPVPHSEFDTYEKTLYPKYFGAIKYYSKLKQMFI